MRGPEIIARNQPHESEHGARRACRSMPSATCPTTAASRRNSPNGPKAKAKPTRVTNALFRAYFVDVKNIGKVEPLAQIAEGSDLPATKPPTCSESQIQRRR